MARSRVYAKVELRLDVAAIVKCLNGANNGSERGLQLVRKIQSLILGNWSARIRHVYRKANRVADMLANMGVEQAEGFIVYGARHASIRELLLADIIGVTTPRVITM